MADDAPWRPAGAPDAVDGVAAQLHHSSMCTTPKGTERFKRVISPEDGSRVKRLDSRRSPKKPPRAEMQLVTPQGREDENAARTDECNAYAFKRAAPFSYTDQTGWCYLLQNAGACKLEDFGLELARAYAPHARVFMGEPESSTPV